MQQNTLHSVCDNASLIKQEAVSGADARINAQAVLSMYLQHTQGVTHPTLSDVPPELSDDDASGCVSIWTYPTDYYRRASHIHTHHSQ